MLSRDILISKVILMKALRVSGVFTLLNEDRRGCRRNSGAGFFSELVLIGCNVGTWTGIPPRRPKVSPRRKSGFICIIRVGTY